MAKPTAVAAEGASSPTDVLPSVDWRTPIECFVLPLAPTWEDQSKRLSRNIKESLRKCRNAPKREGLDLEFDVVRDASQIPGAVDDLIRLHAERADLAETVGHPNVFASVRSRHFLHEVVRRLADKDAACAFRLRLEGRTIAARIGFQVGDVLYLYYSGFEPSFARYSVMTNCLMQAIRWAIDSGLKSINFSVGRDVSKTRWGPDVHVFNNGVVVSPTLRGRGLRSAYEAAVYISKHERVRAVSERLRPPR